MLNDMSRFVGEGRSTTLYTLLDLLHTNTGVAVVGISTVNGVLDLMEKRAKSRFSQHVYSVPILSATQGDEVRPPESCARLAHDELCCSLCRNLKLSDAQRCPALCRTTLVQC